MDSDPVPPSNPSNRKFQLPRQLPVMVLTSCFLFPGCCLPLFIFEDRYRKMLAHALATDRMFCIGVRSDEAGDADEILPVSTAGLIRVSVRNDDGTSHVLLHGLSRVRIGGWVQLHPFRIAEIEPWQSVAGDDRRIQALRAEALELIPEPADDACEALKLLRESLSGSGDAEMVCDVLSYHFVRRAPALHALLTERSLEKRYQMLVSEMRRTGAGQ